MGHGGQGARVWYKELIHADDETFDSNTYLLTKQRAEQIKAPPDPPPTPDPDEGQQPLPEPRKVTLRLAGTVPMESWNTVVVRILTKLRDEEGLNIGVNLSVSINSDQLQSMEEEVRQVLTDLKLNEQIRMSTDPQ